ncbi:MAG: hypothetical protein HY540_08040 [Deltaproteobacteria bacterium]|nr:hypothetical protein [Deltaproteobacteria bacterium]
MLTLFFSRKSIIPKMVEAVGLGLWFISLQRAHSGFAILLLIAMFLAYGFIRTCTLHRWYKAETRRVGIEVHFANVTIGTAYALTIFLGAFVITAQPIFIFLGMLPLGLFVYVSATLIHYHRTDNDPTPINFYSSGQFLHPDRSEAYPVPTKQLQPA